MSCGLGRFGVQANALWWAGEHAAGRQDRCTPLLCFPCCSTGDRGRLGALSCNGKSPWELNPPTYLTLGLEANTDAGRASVHAEASSMT